MLEARSLTKYYSHTPAVRGVSFTIRPGEILGYLGPNGAGKSTTVKMLTGLIEPSEGRIFYQGRSVYDDLPAFQRRLGYVPEEAHLYPHLSGREYLQLMGRLRGMPRRVLEPKADEFLRLFSLWDDRYSPLSSYSKGMRQKVLLSAALLHDPEVLILDEPFSGLDVTSALMLRSLLRTLAARGKLILYSSHVLEVVEKICSTVLILRQGEVAAYDSIDRLRELMSQPSLEGVFAQLAQVDDGEALAGEIVEVMSYGGAPPGSGSPPPPRPPEPPVETGLRLYRAIAGAYPQEFRNAYGDELLQLGEDAIEPVWRRHGMGGLVRVLLDIAMRLPGEYLREAGRDLRFALRSLAGSPGFTLVALLSLALGICIVTCAFSEMNGMALRTIPGVERPEQLAGLQMPVSYPAYQRYRAHGDLFTSAMAYVAPVPFGVSLGGPAERRWGHLVTSSYFSTLGVRASSGRLFGPEEDQAAGVVPVVISYRYWQERFGSGESAIGRQLRINAQPATVIGVGPKDFSGASPWLFGADLWVPVTAGERIAPELADKALERRDRTIFRMVGRLAPGIELPRAEAELDAAAQQFEQEYGESDRSQKGRRVTLVEGGKLLPLRKQDLPFFTSFFTVVAGLVLLIAFANVANMMVARAAGRRKEIAVRLALGASRARIVRQLLIESLLLVAGAAIPGCLLSVWLLHLMSGIRMPFVIPVAFDLQVDWRALLLTTALTGFMGVFFGLIPALGATRPDLVPALKEGGDVRLRGYRRFSLRNILMVSQFTGSLTLLVIVGTLSLGIQTTMGIQGGFEPANLQLISLDPVRDGYSGTQAAAFFDRLLDRVKLLPAVRAAALTESVPVSLGFTRGNVSAQVGGTQKVLMVIRHTVGRDYFDTTAIPLLRGRAFRKDDEVNQTPSAIVSQACARELWNGEDALGRQFEIGADETIPAKVMPGTFDYRLGRARAGRQVFQVVGVAGDVAEGLLVGKPRPAIYFPLRASDYMQPSASGLTLIVRAAPGADAVTPVRREIAALDANITTFNIRTMPEQIDQFMSPLRSASWTYACIGIFGLVLSAVGLAGMTAYAVAQRGREIGIRVALGARGGNVLALVLRESLMLIAAGTAIGMAFAWTGARLLAVMNASVGQVTSTSASDPVVLLGAPLLLACLALLACYVPARRSTRIDPVVALRQE